MNSKCWSKSKAATAPLLVMMHSTVGTYDERIKLIEEMSGC